MTIDSIPDIIKNTLQRDPSGWSDIYKMSKKEREFIKECYYSKYLYWKEYYDLSKSKIFLKISEKYLEYYNNIISISKQIDK